jgi:error-prone DNA polymerase
VSLLATNDVHYHVPERRPLQDVVTCIREKCRLDEAGARLFANAERHLKAPAEMARLLAPWPEALATSLEIVTRCRFSLDELAYDYPVQDSYDGRTPQQELERRTWIGAEWRYGKVPEKVQEALRHELALIAELRYAPYFLTVHDIVSYARSRGILCQGRGSAANSAVCYVLGVTAVDPARVDLLFERFVSAERDEPPDIDVDFEHGRREEVIQHIYSTYGRDHAALAATVIRYRSKSAIREVGKVMGLSADAQDAMSRTVWGWGKEGLRSDWIRQAGLDPADPLIRRTLQLAQELIDFPRHLSQHVGGFVIARSPLRELVPIENAAMPDRTVVEWDKDDLEALKMLKIDVLALGMLTCIRNAFDLLRSHYGVDLDLAKVPPEDPAVYEMLSDADSIGVFQVESRAQMSMLPRLKPRCFYDLVIEVAIVRPGPIQGDMVHPYLRRREGKEPVQFPSAELEAVLGRTLGVPLFQEQAMRIAIVAAGFTPAQADGLRRAMAAFRRHGHIEHYRQMLVGGMAARGYDPAFAERCFRQIEGFGY